MGKGDRKTAKGKRYNSSYGNARSKAVTKAAGSAAAVRFADFYVLDEAGHFARRTTFFHAPAV